MKKSLLFIAVFSLFLCPIKAQEKVEKIQLEKNAKLISAVDLGKKGLLLKLGGAHNKLRFYTSSFEMKWETPLKTNGGFDASSYPVIVSYDGDYVYQIEYQGLRFGKMILNQIDKTGKIKTHEKKIDFKNQKTIFCDSRYLYFLCTQNGNELVEKMTEEKLILNKFDHTSFTQTKSIIDLPKIKDPDNSTFWTYAGHNNDEIFLISKVLEEMGKKITYNVVSVNSDGKVLKNISLHVNLDNKFVRPSRNAKSYYDISNGSDDDFFDLLIGSSVSSTMKPLIGAMSNIVIDKDNHSIYIYGLYGPKPYVWEEETDNEGYFICKFDMEGNPVFQLQKNAPGSLLMEKYFAKHPREYAINTQFSINADQSVNFRIFYKNFMHTFMVSNKGELAEYFMKTYKDYISYAMRTPTVETIDIEFFNSHQNETKFETYKKSIDEKKLKKLKFQFCRSALGEIVVENNSKEDEVKLLYFDSKK
ncbi:MAG TPA: hypothetical protein VIH57_03865 [Bacteroidales bacterium]